VTGRLADEGRFDRLLKLVSDDMEGDRALKVISALGVNALTDKQRQVVKDVMNKYLKSLPQESQSFVNKFKMWLAYPPADKFESILHEGKYIYLCLSTFSYPLL
jgi:hypothetical protein